MSAQSYRPQRVCPTCGELLAPDADCPHCRPARPSRTSQPRTTAASTLRESLAPLVKWFLILVVLALPTYFSWRLLSGLWRSVEEDNPYPLDERVAVQRFWTSLAQEADQDYQGCYNLLYSQNKAAVIAGLNSRATYAEHFDRIRNYLVSRVGADFLARMTLNPDDPAEATFGNSVVLHLELTPVQGLEGKTHYAIRRVAEFPHDVAPRLGVEEYNRQLEAAAGDTRNARDPFPDASTPQQLVRVLPSRYGEAHLQKILDIYRASPMLDDRHLLLDFALRVYPDSPALAHFLQTYVLSQEQAVHLRRLAEDFLARRQTR